MRIGQFVEVMKIVPDETPGLGGDGEARRRESDAGVAVVGPRVDPADAPNAGRPAYAS